MDIHTPERRILVNYACADLIPGRQLHVTEVMLDQYAIRIEYILTPPLPGVNPEAGDRPPIRWLWHGTDDLGNRYTDCGGAYGLSVDARSTRGVLSLQPLPPPEACSLRIVLNPWFRSELDARECAFDVDLSAG